MPSAFLAKLEPGSSSLRPLLCFLLQDRKGSHSEPPNTCLQHQAPAASGFESGRHRLSVQMPCLRRMELAVLLFTLACRMRGQEASVCGSCQWAGSSVPLLASAKSSFPSLQFSLRTEARGLALVSCSSLPCLLWPEETTMCQVFHTPA